MDLSLWLMGLLLGGSVGALFCVQRLSFRAQSLPWLVGGWLLCFALHLYAVSGAYLCVQGGLRRGRWANPSLRQDPAIAVGVRSLSGLHRLAKGAADRDKPWVKTLVESYQTPEVKEFILAKFKGAVLPSW